MTVLTESATPSNRGLGRGIAFYSGSSVGCVRDININLNASIDYGYMAAYGKAPIVAYDAGCAPVITCMQEETTLAFLNSMLAGGTTSGATKVGFSGVVGSRITPASFAVCPIDTSDPIQEYYFPKAVPRLTGEIAFKPEDTSGRLFGVEYTVIVDTSQTAGFVVGWALSTTGTDSTAPTVTFSPADGATGVTASQVLALTFSEEINTAKINSANFIVVNVTDDSVVSTTFTNSLVSPTEHIVYISPATTWTLGTKSHSIFVTTNVTDVTGNALAAVNKCDFVTAGS